MSSRMGEARALSRALAKKSPERGAAMISVLVTLVALIATASLALDGGMVWVARSQMQNAVDSAALSGAANMIDPAIPATTLGAATAAAQARAGSHQAVGTSTVVVDPADIRFGSWDLGSRSFDDSVDLNDPEVVTAVEVRGALDGVVNGPVPAFMARIVGRTSFLVSASATAYLGYAGAVAPGAIDLPIAIDCCKLKGPDCQQDYCQTIASNPPNPCSLLDPQDDGVTTVSCLEFNSTPEQNACWTVFDPVQPAVNTADLTGLVANTSDLAISGAEPVYIDNGDKTPVLGDIRERFKGEGAFNGDPNGVDRYPPYDGDEDSWVVGLPVVECQTDSRCAGGDPARIVGFVCFEIREITVVPDKIIRGRFLCESDPLFQQCDIGDTVSGGLDFGIRADIPVLVR